MDGYLGVCNNYMLYDDISNDRLVLSAQDLDLVMGTALIDPKLIHGGDYTKYPGFSERPLTTRMLQVPQFKQDFENIFYNISKKLINPTVLGPRIDQMFAMLSEDVAWDKELPRVGKDYISQNLGDIGVNGTDGEDKGGYFDEILKRYSYKTFVYGPSFSNVSMAITEWVDLKSSNVMGFYNQTLEQNTSA
jgi:hypothetical protein